MAQATDESSTNVTPLRRADPTNAERQRRHRAKKRRPTVTPKPARSVTPPVTRTVTVERHGSVTVTTATLIAALALATCSAAFSISGLTSIFAGAFWPVIGLGVAFELGKLSAVAWLGHRGAAPARAHRPRRRSDGAQLDRRLRLSQPRPYQASPGRRRDRGQQDGGDRCAPIGTGGRRGGLRPPGCSNRHHHRADPRQRPRQGRYGARTAPSSLPAAPSRPARLSPSRCRRPGSTVSARPPRPT